MPSYRIGVDVGGTFTDLVLLDEETGEVFETKVLTTSPNPAEGVLKVIRKALKASNADGDDVRAVFHGTTIATNSLIERIGAKTALITSKGCRDVLEIGRQIRPSLFDWNAEKPEPLEHQGLGSFLDLPCSQSVHKRPLEVPFWATLNLDG